MAKFDIIKATIRGIKNKNKPFKYFFMLSLYLNNIYDINKIKKRLQIKIDKYVALEDKSDILKKAVETIKKAITEIYLTLVLSANKITNGILKHSIVARIFLFPYSPTSLVF
tara:strand:+ start:800 stop:1135 length:336 start_codon:yes stop_codon:yes gene_type:complete